MQHSSSRPPAELLGSAGHRHYRTSVGTGGTGEGGLQAEGTGRLASEQLGWALHRW
jgi:hypothetical protein